MLFEISLNKSFMRSLILATTVICASQLLGQAAPPAGVRAKPNIQSQDCTQFPSTQLGKISYTDPDGNLIAPEDKNVRGLKTSLLHGHEKPFLKTWTLLFTNPDFTQVDNQNAATKHGKWCYVRDQVYQRLNLSYGTIDLIYGVYLNHTDAINSVQTWFQDNTKNVYGGGNCPDTIDPIIK